MAAEEQTEERPYDRWYCGLAAGPAGMWGPWRRDAGTEGADMWENQHGDNIFMPPRFMWTRLRGIADAEVGAEELQGKTPEPCAKCGRMAAVVVGEEQVAECSVAKAPARSSADGLTTLFLPGLYGRRRHWYRFQHCPYGGPFERKQPEGNGE